MKRSLLNEYARKAVGAQINLAIGQLPNRPPREVLEGVSELLRSDCDHGKYLPTGGSNEARSAVAKVFKAAGIKSAEADNCILGNGAKELFMNALMAVRKGAENLIWFEPGYPVYRLAAEAAGLHSSALFCGSPNYWPSDGDFDKAVQGYCDNILVVNNPVNPTGRVWPYQSGGQGGLAAVAREVEKHDLLVIADETYSDFVYEGEFTSFASIPGMAERTITINSGSKAFRAPSYRLGYATGPKWAIDGMEAYAGNCTGCPNFAADWLAKQLPRLRKASKADLPWLAENRALIMEWTTRHKEYGLDLTSMDGAYFAFLRFYEPRLAKLADDLLLRGIGVIPGTAFASPESEEGFRGCIRLSYAVEKPVLEKGLEIISEVVRGK